MKNSDNGALRVTKTATLILFLFLSACASPKIDPDAANFDNEIYQADLFNCRGGTVLEATATSLGVAAFGAFWGAMQGAPAGAMAGDTAEGIAIGAAVGAVAGFGYGAIKAIEKHDGEIVNCLRDKGYEITG